MLQEYNYFKWAIKKDIFSTFEVGDFIFVKQINNNWTLKQYPKINGGIVAIDPYNGDVKALVGGFSFKSSEFNRVTQAKRHRPFPRTACFRPSGACRRACAWRRERNRIAGLPR